MIILCPPCTPAKWALMAVVLYWGPRGKFRPLMVQMSNQDNEPEEPKPGPQPDGF